MKQKVRRIRFGLQFKFAVIMIAGVAFTVAPIALAIFKQQDKAVTSSILKWGAGLLAVPVDDAVRFLMTEQSMVSPQMKAMNPAQAAALGKQMSDSQKKVQDYFSSLIRNERGIDIAFLISIKWSNAAIDWSRWDQSLFRYYHRQNGALFAVRGGRVDHQLKPSIYSHYMNTIDLNPRISFTSSTVNNRTDEYIILGMPLFRNSPRVYREYLETIHAPVQSRKDELNREKKLKVLMLSFLDRIVAQADFFDYRVLLANPRDRKPRFCGDV